MPETNLLPTMRDRGVFWTPQPDWTSAELTRDGWSAKPVLGLHRVMISGKIEATMASLAPNAPSIGLWQIASGPVHALRIARDRVLFVADQPLAVTPGWSSDGYAASVVDDAWATFELSGPALADLVAEMTFVDLGAESPSAATIACGTQVLLHRVAQDRARIHVDAPLATYLWHWLERR